MAGEIRGNSGIPKPVRKSRKLWSLQDRSVVSVNLLKANLAEDGCEEAQLDIAKKLLNEASLEITDGATQDDNFRLAIYWFIKCSEQGNDEATRNLKECYESGQGITCHNILDVKACISTPKNEKLTFKAARRLYTKLCNGEDFITTTQLQARLDTKAYETKVSFGKRWQDYGHHDPNETFVVTSDEDDKEPNNSCKKAAEAESVSIGRNNDGVKLTQDDLLQMATRFNAGELPSITIRSSAIKSSQEWNIFNLWSAFIIQFLFISTTLKLMDKILGMFLGVMFLSLWSSYNFILWKKRHQTFQDWSKAFHSVLKQEVLWDNRKQASQFHNTYLRPFILTNVACLTLFVLVDGYFLLKVIIGSISVLSLFLGRIVNPLQNWQLLVASLLQLLSFKFFAYFTPNIPKIKLLDYIDLTHVSLLPFSYGLSLSNSILLIQTIVLIHFVVKKRSYIFNEIIPEVLGMSWILKIIDWSVEHTAMEEYNILIGLALLIMSLYITFESSINMKKMLIGIGVTASLLMLSFSGLSRLLVEMKSNNTSMLLEWPHYEQNCHRSAWKMQSVAETQMKCRGKYSGSRVKWAGKLSYVQLKDSDENVDIVFEMLMSIGNKELLIRRESSSDWTWFDYIIPNALHRDTENQLALAPVALLISMAEFKDSNRSNIIHHILNFRTGDVLEFIGTLSRNPGGFKPEVSNIESLTCISCLIGDGGMTLDLHSHKWKLKTAYDDMKLNFPVWW